MSASVGSLLIELIIDLSLSIDYYCLGIELIISSNYLLLIFLYSNWKLYYEIICFIY